MYEPRFYREWADPHLVNFTVRDEETDILISAKKNLEKVSRAAVARYRQDIKRYIEKNPEFKTSLTPLAPDTKAPEIVESMCAASRKCGVGPMASVAGAINDFLGKDLLQFTDEIIMENGGDLFIRTLEARNVSIYAGNSVLNGKIKIRIKPKDTPLAICTSSGTFGHSLSFGKADAVSVVSKRGALADACATAACNMVKDANSIEEALNFAKTIEGVMGAVVIYGEKLGTIGEIELI